MHIASIIKNHNKNKKLSNNYRLICQQVSGLIESAFLTGKIKHSAPGLSVNYRNAIGSLLWCQQYNHAEDQVKMPAVFQSAKPITAKDFIIYLHRFFSRYPVLQGLSAKALFDIKSAYLDWQSTSKQNIFDSFYRNVEIYLMKQIRQLSAFSQM